ncbi:hypothetical protein C8R45DRAFT_1015449 [Mycena sanguinolenta]|nr:hypothetical protein C8R45DRAFT_1015449 [Mycena sanguinolenta]
MDASLNCDIYGDVVMNNAFHEGEKVMGIHILQRSVAVAAMHDSVESYPQPRCHPDTRMKILEDLRGWALHGEDPCILWRYGRGDPASSILWLGFFFFKRGHATRGNAKTLFATIAYQLALRVPPLKTPIYQIAERDPLIVVRTLAVQMRKLIFEPGRAYENGGPVTILIDGLDECEGQDIQNEILRIIRHSFSQDSLPLRFIIASRPEPHIREMFHSPDYAGHYCSLNVEQSFADVRKYLRDEFSRIHREHHIMARVPSPWPSSDVLEVLVHKSSGHFIYAATIIKFVDDKNYRPTQRLALVQSGSGRGSDSVFDTLDQLYMAILGSLARQAELIPILCAIVHFELGVADIDQLFEFPGGEAHLLLRGLHSLLQVPSNDNFEVIHSHHASFLDFLNDSGRSHHFYVGSLDHRMDLARSFLRLCASAQYKPIRGLFESRRPHFHLIPFITSLPPSVELCPLIARMEPDYIFALQCEKFVLVPATATQPVWMSGKSWNQQFGVMLSWLERTPSAPQDLVRLWQDYVFMASFMLDCHECTVKRIDSPSSELSEVLVITAWVAGIRGVTSLLDITWSEFRTIICSLRPDIASAEQVLRGSATQVIEELIPPDTKSWTCRNIALKYIPRIIKHNDGMVAEHKWDDVATMLKLCPPCSILYPEFQRIPRSVMKSGLSGRLWSISDIFGWLESFRDPKLELAAFWKQEMLPEAD